MKIFLVINLSVCLTAIALLLMDVLDLVVFLIFLVLSSYSVEFSIIDLFFSPEDIHK